MVLALCSDLFFTARIRETAKAAGVECEILRDPALLPARAGAGATLVIVDMNLKTGDAAEAVRQLKLVSDVTVVGFLHDAHDELIRAARAAGCDRVLSRGGLTAKLPDLLKSASGS